MQRYNRTISYSLGETTANDIREIVNVRLQIMSSRIPLLGYANKVREVHSRYGLVPCSTWPFIKVIFHEYFYSRIHSSK